MILNNDLRPEQYNPHSIRMLERASIRAFMELHRDKLTGRVLDFGAGKQPYRDLCTGEYVPFEKGENMGPDAGFDAIICNQVIEYVKNPRIILRQLWDCLKDGGHLVLTYPSAWPEVDGDLPDFWRFTKAGINMLLADVSFEVLHHEMRAEVMLNGFQFPLGGGVVARKVGVWALTPKL